MANKYESMNDNELLAALSELAAESKQALEVYEKRNTTGQIQELKDFKTGFVPEMIRMFRDYYNNPDAYKKHDEL